MTAKVSVVTPFYNSNDYLGAAIESVLAQTYADFEYVLVNNRSTDRSAAIAEGFARRDPRVRVVHNEEFLSQIQNYNHALRQASPDARYIKMVQADDEIFPRCLEEMVHVADSHPSVGVVSAYRTLGNTIWPPGLWYQKTVMTGRDACRLCLIDDLSLFGSPTTVMMRADLVRARDPFYSEGRPFEDSDVIYELLRTSDFAFVQQILTFTRIEEGSTWGRTLSYGPLLLDKVLRLRSFGAYYLSAEEHQRLTVEHEQVYRRFLADAWLKRREPKFWEYHRKALASIGERVELRAILPEVPPVLLSYLFQPGRVGTGILRHARRRWRPAEP